MRTAPCLNPLQPPWGTGAESPCANQQPLPLLWAPWLLQGPAYCTQALCSSVGWARGPSPNSLAEAMLPLFLGDTPRASQSCRHQCKVSMPTRGPQGSFLCRIHTHTHARVYICAHTAGLQTPHAHKQEVPGPSTQEDFTLKTRPRRMETGVLPGVRGWDCPWGPGSPLG